METDPVIGAPRSAWIRSPEGGWWRFAGPVAGRVARRAVEVPELLGWVEEGAERGHWAVGYVAYEAAPGFDAALAVRSEGECPLAAFSLFAPPRLEELPRAASAGPGVESLEPDLSAAEHAHALAAIHAAIARGETYQVNFTFPLRGRRRVSPEELFFALAPISGAPLAAFLDLGERAVVSLSPELFFERDGELVRMRPMKGTRRRGRFREEDERLAAELGAAAKDRAENLMIVDMARNDLGRVARPGTVRATSLFDVERYPTVWQMTSSVEAESGASLPQLFAALFPCASVTGAPKPRTMEFIARLERGPRGVYCGAIGWVAPGGRARFSVAIRTALCERATTTVEYRVGSGVVWDSAADEEYAECLDKGLALAADPAPFGLVETFRVSSRGSCPPLALHLRRLADSAAHFGLACDRRAVNEALDRHLAQLATAAPAPGRPRAPGARRVRLTLSAEGSVSVESEPFTADRRSWHLVLASGRVDSRDPLLFHKTTRRERHEAAYVAARARGADEALLCNERGELTEGTRTNLFLKLDGRWLTPARECGLLAGVARERLLRSGRAAEAILPCTALARAERILLANSLRGLLEGEMLEPPAGESGRLSPATASRTHFGPEER